MQVELLELVAHPSLDLRLGYPLALHERQGDVFDDVEEIKQRGVLEDIAELLLERFLFGGAHLRAVLALETDRPAVGLQQANDVFEQDALAGSAFADDGGDLTPLNAQVDAVEHAVEPE